MFLFSVLIVSFFVLNGDVYLHWEKIIDKNIKGEEVVEGNGFVVNTKGVLIEYRGFDKYVTIPREIKGITITSDEDFSCFVIDICYNIVRTSDFSIQKCRKRGGRKWIKRLV